MLADRNGADSGRFISARQIERERAALAGCAGHANLPTQQPGDFAADRQTEAGAAVSAIRRAISLLEGLENDPLLFRSYDDAGIGGGKRNYFAGAVERFEIVSLIARGRGNLQDHVALLGELECIGKQVHQYLLQALVISEHGRTEIFTRLNEEAEVLVLSELMEAAFQLGRDVVDGNI